MEAAGESEEEREAEEEEGGVAEEEGGLFSFLKRGASRPLGGSLPFFFNSFFWRGKAHCCHGDSSSRLKGSLIPQDAITDITLVDHELNFFNFNLKFSRSSLIADVSTTVLP